MDEQEPELRRRPDPADEHELARLLALWRGLADLRRQDPERRRRLLESLHLDPDQMKRLWGALDVLGDLHVVEPGSVVDPDGCELGWQPSVRAPVFYGTADLGPPDGLPTRVRVFYPSVEGSPAGAPIVAGCGRYPLVAFLHGQCLQTDHYLSWNRLPALLARSGYVVVVPALQSIPPFADPNPEVSLVDDVVRWMRSSWVHRGALLPPPMTAVVGHSWGALLGASVAIRLQAQHSLSAFASLSGGWTEWPPVPPLPLRSVMVPSMFMWGTGDSDNFSRIGPGMWDALQPAKHKVVFTGGEHWDYLRSTPCGQRPGPCNLVASLAADFLLTFLSHYLPPERWSLLRYTIPHSLVPPPLQLTQAQEFFAGGHLAGFAEIENSQVCRVRHTWDIPLGGRGTVSLPFRWTSPWFPWPW